MYAIIPAGGRGSRLWPVSRTDFPKHLLNLTGHGSMIQDTVDRLEAYIPPENIIVISEESHADQIRDQLPSLPAANLLIEPERRDTASVIGLGLCHVLKRDPEAVVASLHADHVIKRTRELLRLLRIAARVATRHTVIVTLGIRPTCPSTAYGYIKSKDVFSKIEATDIYQVEEFTEKPDLKTAQEFISSDRYYWNAGMFIARASVLLDAYRDHAPAIYEPLMHIARSIGTAEEATTLAHTYPVLPRLSIDTAIMEKVDNMVVIPADIGWDDIGSWKTVKGLLPRNNETNFVFGQHIGVDTSESLIYSAGSRLIATIGLQNMIVIDTGDATLICPMDRAEEVKKIVEKLKERKRTEYL